MIPLKGSEFSFTLVYTVIGPVLIMPQAAVMYISNISTKYGELLTPIPFIAFFSVDTINKSILLVDEVFFSHSLL